jgi:cytidyltransferase-like protein
MSNNILTKMDRPIVVVVSGGFDPIHEGHVHLINEANNLAKSKYDSVVVGLNSDDWLIRKKGFFFMNLNERIAVMSAIKGVLEVMPFNDRDGTAVDLLNKVKKQYINHDILFANGGDRGPSNIPENDIEGIQYHFGIGGDYKSNSSTDILKRYEDSVRRKVLSIFKSE